MTEHTAQAQRAAAIGRLFISFGVDDETRQEVYLRELSNVDPTMLDHAVGDVLLWWTETRLPPIGAIRESVRKVAARSSQAQPLPDPRSPRQGQIGAGSAVGRVLAATTSRVPGMSKIFARAKEIRAAGLVPPDLWGRFASEVMAELESDPHADVSPEMRRCMAHAKAWREERAIEWSRDHPPQEVA